MRPPEPVQSIAAALLSAPTPLLLPDTSCLLNVLEVPSPRERVSVNVVSGLTNILRRSRAAPSEVRVVVAQTVVNEWGRHHALKRESAEKAFRATDELVALAWSIAHNLASAPDRPVVQFAGLRLGERLHDMVEEVLQNAPVIADDDQYAAAAGIRVRNGLAPASLVKPEFADCLLIEQHLALCRELRSSGFNKPCVFVCSNVKDFGEPKAPRPPLDREFAQCGITFVYDLAAADALLSAG